MSETYQFALPLLQGAQAQKHVTVNEALSRLDAVTQLRVKSATLSAPPVSAGDGEAWLVPVGAGGLWQSRSGEIALYANGGWVFLTPKAGWCLWDEALGAKRCFDGTAWISDAQSLSAGGAATVGKTVEIDHGVAAGASSITVDVIPSHAQVLGVTGRVISAIAGTGITDWGLGVAGAEYRYGSGLGLGLNAYVKGVSGTPVTYYADTPLVLTANGGDFTGGTVRLAVHFLELLPPRSV